MGEDADDHTEGGISACSAGMKFRIKMMLSTTILLALFYVIGAFLLIMVSFQYSINKEKDTALTAHRMVYQTILLTAGNGLEPDYEAITDTVSQMDMQNRTIWSGLRLYRVDGARTYYENGVLAVDTDDEDVQQMEDELSSLVRFRQMDSEYYLQLTGLVSLQDETLILESCYNVTQIYEMRTLLIQIYRIILLVVIAVGAPVAWFIAKRLTAPIQQLSAVSRKIADGNLSIRANIHSGDEIERLAVDFNEMTDRIEENIRQLAEAMRRQEEFMGSFAHELKTPMTSIIGYADLLRGQSLSPQEQQEAANYIFSEGKRLESLSLKLLDLLVLKKRDFELREESLAAVVASVVPALRPSMEKNHITLHCQCEDGVCMLEPDLVKSLIINLVDNARKAMDSGGIIIVKGKLTDSGCELTVVDNGRGMPREELNRITEAFYRVDKSRSRAQGGAGLGLALCSEIIALHHGDMAFESTPGKGTVVRVRLNGGRK